MKTCIGKLKDTKIMNPWYLPTVPTTILTFNDICKSHADLFQQMQVKGIDNMPKAV